MYLSMYPRGTRGFRRPNDVPITASRHGDMISSQRIKMIFRNYFLGPSPGISLLLFPHRNAFSMADLTILDMGWAGHVPSRLSKGGGVLGADQESLGEDVEFVSLDYNHAFVLCFHFLLALQDFPPSQVSQLTLCVKYFLAHATTYMGHWLPNPTDHFHDGSR